MTNVRILELYSGTKSVSKAMKEFWPGATVVSVDIDPKYSPDICVDVTEWNFYEMYEHDSFDVIWASPPCTHYSNANRGKRDIDDADRTASVVFDIIDYIQPSFWFVENPATGLMRHREWIWQWMPYMKTCTYCMYGTLYKKATNIWSNVDTRLRVCSRLTPCADYERLGYHTRTAQRGPSISRSRLVVPGCPRDVLWTVPKALVFQLCEATNIPRG